MRKFIKKYVQSCISCTLNLRLIRHCYLHPIPNIPCPFHIIHINYLDPTCKSKQGDSYILTIVDAFIKFCFVRAVRNIKAKHAINKLNAIVQTFDSGKAFISKKFENFVIKGI